MCTKQRSDFARPSSATGGTSLSELVEKSDIVPTGWGSFTQSHSRCAQRGADVNLCQHEEVFWRQFAAYAGYHRDKRNCAMHIIGTPLLFLAAVLPFSLLSVTVLGIGTTAAAVLVIPALIFWMVLDLAIGVAIACAVVPLLVMAAITAEHVGAAWVWATTAMLIVIGWSLQIVGHSFFEQRRPALLDNPLHMLMSPMFIVAKLFVKLGFRRDLAAVLSEQASDKAPDTECGQGW